MLRGLAAYVPFLSRLLADEGEENEKEEEDVVPLESARVAVVGAGVGGCLAAYFLREKGGEALQVDVFERGEVGGRTATFTFQGHVRETGASIIHTCNKHLVDLSKEFGLETKKDISSVPVGVYNGKEFLFRTGWWKLINIVCCAWRYGTSLLTIYSSVTSVLNQISNIYSLQSRGEVYHTVPDMLRAMGGEELYHLTQISAKQYLQQELCLQEMLTRELITGAMYMNYGQGLEVCACTCMVALAGLQEESLWAVVGGNRLIPQTALVRSGAKLRKCSVTSITRTVGDGGRVSYFVQTDESGEQASEMGEYDAVIVATPLYEQSIQFKNFPTPVYTEEITATMYQRTVAEFVDGEINPAFFGLRDNDGTFPLILLTSDFVEGSPFPFCSVSINIPSEEPESANEKYEKPLPEEPSRVWKIFSPQPLTREEKQQMFKTINAEATVDWLAYPNYNPPESFPPFDLDTGVFYVNGIEKAASAMEMSAIAAKNCALLARQYLKSRYMD